MLSKEPDNSVTINNVRLFYLYETYLKKNSAAAVHVCEISNNFPNYAELYCVGPGSDSIFKNGKNIYNISLKSRFKFIRIIRYIFNEPLRFISLGLLSYRYKPNLLLVRNGISISPYILSKMLNIPVVLEVNGLRIAEQEFSSNHPIINRVLEVSEKLALKTSKKIISVSDEISLELAKKYDLSLEKFAIIPNGVNTRLFVGSDSLKCKEMLNLNINNKYVCFIGSFMPWHGLEHLIMAAPLILEQVPNTKFIFVGDGRTKSSIIKMVEALNFMDNFIFIKNVSYEDVPIYINASDVCIILKRKNIPGSPLKLKEYMACGKPVVATKSSDFRILNDCSAGILVDYENITELTGAIIKLLQNQELCETMGKNGRDYVLSHYSWKKVADRVAAVCLDVLNNK